jgi:hypothetical protein
MCPQRWLRLALIVTIGASPFAWPRGTLATKPPALKLRSAGVDVVGLTYSPSNGPSLTLILTSKANTPLWVRAVFISTSSGQSCDYFERLEPAQSVRFACYVDTLVAGREYPMTVAVHGDSAMTQLIERANTVITIDRDDVERMKGLRQAATLPRTYPQVDFRNNVGAFVSVPASGTLIVGPDSVVHQNFQRKVSVGRDQIRSVEVRPLERDGRQWLIIHYEVAGKPKVMAIQPRTEGAPRLEHVHISIVALRERGAEGAPAPAPE